MKSAFLEDLKGFKARRLAILKSHLEAAQKLMVEPLSPENVFSVIGGPASYLSFLDYDLTGEQIDFLFSGLEEGTTQKAKTKKIGQLQERINELNVLINNELSPQARWFHTPAGNPIRYPDGCRWTRFVKTWKEVVSRHSEPVNIEGYKLNGEGEKDAYYLLELDKEPKRTPLSEGSERNRR